MNIIPKRKVVFRTQLGREEVRRRLYESDEYMGFVGPSSFIIHRIIFYRNSFLPQIKGDIYDDNQATIVKMTMQVHVHILIFMAIYIAGALFFCCALMPDILFSEFDIVLLIPFGMLAWGILFTYIPFWAECRKSKKDMCRILEAEIVRKY